MQRDHGTQLVALGKILEGGGLPYTVWLMHMMW